MITPVKDQILSTAKLEWANGWLSSPKGQFIDGKWIVSTAGKFIESIDPATSNVIGSLNVASKIEIDAAVNAARKAFENNSWRKMPRRVRATCLNKMASLLREHAAELATLEALDNGKTYKEAFIDDLPEAADVLDYYAGWIDKFYGENCPVDDGYLNYTRHEPLGVCGLIIPWNFPLLLAMWKIAPALAMGNTVIVKPSEFTSLSLVRAVEIFHEADLLPPGVLNLVLGDGQIGEYLCQHNGVDKISFTGSTQTGKKIVQASASSNLKLLGLELGGKSANIVFADTPDLPFAVERSFQAMFSHKGEKCSEPTRLFVERKIYDDFLSELAKLADEVVLGNQFEPASQQGPQCHQKHFDKIMQYIELGKKSESRLIAGGSRDENGTNRNGLFIRPTIFADVDNKNVLAQEEIFGPVLVVTAFDTEEEAVKMANDTIYGLAAGLWTADVSRAHRMVENLDAGMVFVNRYGCYDFASPFGGYKQSGWGKEMALHSLHGYTKLKSAWIKY